MPTPPTRGGVSSSFGMRVNPNDNIYRMHYGEDTLGDGNYAPATGEVVFAGFDSTGTGLGWCVGIRESADSTVIWWVAHHGRKGATVNPLAVTVGATTREGVTYLGPKGDSGAAKGVHAHTERRVGGAARPGSGTATNPRNFYTSTAGGGATPFPDERSIDMPLVIWDGQNPSGGAARWALLGLRPGPPMESRDKVEADGWAAALGLGIFDCRSAAGYDAYIAWASRPVQIAGSTSGGTVTVQPDPSVPKLLGELLAAVEGLTARVDALPSGIEGARGRKQS